LGENITFMLYRSFNDSSPTLFCPLVPLPAFRLCLFQKEAKGFIQIKKHLQQGGDPSDMKSGR
jgi:hypothetical protein